MAEVTFNTGGNPLVNVQGALMAVYADVDIAANQDTWTTGLRSIVACGSSDPAGVTKLVAAGGVVTLSTGGAVADVKLWAIGYP